VPQDVRAGRAASVPWLGAERLAGRPAPQDARADRAVSVPWPVAGRFAGRPVRQDVRAVSVPWREVVSPTGFVHVWAEGREALELAAFGPQQAGAGYRAAVVAVAVGPEVRWRQAGVAGRGHLDPDAGREGACPCHPPAAQRLARGELRLRQTRKAVTGATPWRLELRC
jgi:hypothetical protein